MMQDCAEIEDVIEASCRARIESEIRNRHDNEEHGLKTKQDCVSYFLTGPYRAGQAGLHAGLK
jgi:hypothetical protein